MKKLNDNSDNHKIDNCINNNLKSNNRFVIFINNMRNILEDNIIINKFLRNTRIRVRLMTSFLLLSIIPLAALGIYSYLKSSKAIDTKIRAYSKEIIIQAGQKIEDELGKVENYAIELSLYDEMQKKIETVVTASEYERYQAVSDLANKMLVKFSPISSISFGAYLLPNGQSIWYKNVNGVKGNTEIADKFGKIADASSRDIVWTAEKLDSKHQLICIRKIKGITWSRDLGYLALGIDSNQFSNIFSNLDIGDGSELFVVDSSGRVISSSNTDELGQMYREEGLIHKISENTDNDGTFDFQNNMILYKKIKGTNWYLVGKIPFKYIHAEPDSIKSSLIIFVIVSFILSMLFSYLISVSISRPLDKMVYMIKEAKNGNLTLNVKDSYKDEIAVVIENFNEMVFNIRMLIEKVHFLAVDNVLKSSESIAKSSKQSHIVSEQISCSINEVAEGASKQVEEVNNTELHMNSLVESFNHVQETMVDVLEVVADTKNISDFSLDTIKMLNDKATESSNASNEVIEDIVELKDNMRQIEKIVEMIVGIANTTKLLALNATIEAAKAGETGKGFGIVAGEIKKLAHRTKNASISINEIINNIQKKTEHTVDTAYEANRIVNIQMDVVKETDTAFRKIYDAMSRISQYVDNVSASLDNAYISKDKAVHSIERISMLANQAASSAEEVAGSTTEQISSAEELALLASKFNDVAHKLREAVDKFKIK